MVGGGEAGDIETDKYGRIKVQFHWDREGKRDEKSSCWIRCVQSWAGKKWGMSFTPRIGMEVMVEFLDGNPDDPIVTGCIFNGDFTPHWSNQGSETQSGLKTRSSKGGGDNEANALRFEDKAGSEYMLLHSQKNQIEFIEDTRHSEIGMDEHHTVKNDRKQLVAQYTYADLARKVVGVGSVGTRAWMTLLLGRDDHFDVPILEDEVP